MVKLPVATVIKIAKENGAERVGADGAQAISNAISKIMERISKESFNMAVHAGRKTIKEGDVKIVVKNLYGIEI